MKYLIPLMALILIFGGSCNGNGCSCGSTPEPNTTKIKEGFKLHPERYNFKKPEVDFKDGFQGIIRIYANHIIKGINKKDKDAKVKFVTSGTGSVIFHEDKLLIVTARHVIQANAKTKDYEIKIGDDQIEKVTFKKINSLVSQVIIGELAIEPVIYYISKDLDLAILEIELSDYSYIQQNITNISDRRYISTTQINPGDSVECWGFPSTETAQIKKVHISVLKGKNIYLNNSLKGGYSGGPVLTSEKKKYPVGMIIRSINENNQSMIIDWKYILEHLEDIPKKYLSNRIKLNQQIKENDVKMTFSKRF